MTIFRDKYILGDVDFFNIRNRNEGRVLRILKELLQTRGSPLISDKDLQDVYALALNALPSRYTQRGTIVLHDPVTKDDIRAAVDNAFDMVVSNPKP